MLSRLDPQKEPLALVHTFDRNPSTQAEKRVHIRSESDHPNLLLGKLDPFSLSQEAQRILIQDEPTDVFVGVQERAMFGRRDADEPDQPVALRRS